MTPPKKAPARKSTAKALQPRTRRQRAGDWANDHSIWVAGISVFLVLLVIFGAGLLYNNRQQSEQTDEIGRTFCIAANRKLLEPLSDATRDAKPRTLAQLDAAIGAAPEGLREVLVDAKSQYLAQLPKRLALYAPFDCTRPLLPQLPPTTTRGPDR